MKPKTRSNMKARDLKEMAWDEYGQEAYQAEMRLRFMMETWPEEYGANGGVSREDNKEREEGV